MPQWLIALLVLLLQFFSWQQLVEMFPWLDDDGQGLPPR